MWDWSHSKKINPASVARRPLPSGLRNMRPESPPPSAAAETSSQPVQPQESAVLSAGLDLEEFDFSTPDKIQKSMGAGTKTLKSATDEPEPLPPLPPLAQALMPVAPPPESLRTPENSVRSVYEDSSLHDATHPAYAKALEAGAQSRPPEEESGGEDLPAGQSAASPADTLGDKDVWEMQLNQMMLPGMELMEVQFIMLDPSWRMEMRKAFIRARRDFCRYIGYHNVSGLLAAGVTDEGIKLLKKGHVPENFNVHIKIPFDYSGTIDDFTNLLLIQTYPFHDALHRFIDMQIQTYPAGMKARRLFVPIARGKIYIPEVDVSTGGGVARPDKSIHAGFIQDTFKNIAIKSMIGARSSDI